jgi:hypothetical protein
MDQAFDGVGVAAARTRDQLDGRFKVATVGHGSAPRAS